jgi:hypothetical protein
MRPSGTLAPIQNKKKHGLAKPALRHRPQPPSCSRASLTPTKQVGAQKTGHYASSTWWMAEEAGKAKAVEQVHGVLWHAAMRKAGLGASAPAGRASRARAVQQDPPECLSDGRRR